MSNNIRGVLCVKGEKGDSAYQVAVKNGFIGSEKDWLATLGTSSHLSVNKYTAVATESQTVITIPDDVLASSFIDLYVDGLKLDKDQYSYDISNKTIEVISGLSENQKIEIVVMDISTNALPIVTKISENSTEDEAASAKTVYDIKQLIPVKPILLWKNPNPDETFAAQKITFLSDEYDMYKVIYREAKERSSLMSNDSVNGYSCLLTGADGYSNTSTARGIYRTDNKLIYNVQDAYAGSEEVNNNYLIPVYIIGYNLGLFEEEE